MRIRAISIPVVIGLSLVLSLAGWAPRNASANPEAAPVSEKDALRSIYFDFNDSHLKPEAISQLTMLAAYLKEHSKLKIRLEGNCGTIGAEAVNATLGQERADAVKKFLVEQGIDPKRLETISYGESRPVVPNCTTEECNAPNRRVEFKVIKTCNK